MRTTTSAAPNFAAPRVQLPADDDNAAMSASALKTAREAIARWTKGTVTSKPVREPGHVSSQARWIAQTQRDLAAWISEGGFSQYDASAAPAAPAAPIQTWNDTPSMYTLDDADVCME